MITLLQSLLGNAVEATVLGAIVGLVTLVFRCAPPLRHCLWLLVLIKLMLPQGILPPLGAGAIWRWAAEKVESRPAVAAALERSTVAAEAGSERIVVTDGAALSSPTALESGWAMWSSLWPFLWAIGSAGMFVWTALRTIAIGRRMRFAANAPEDVLAVARVIARRMDLARVPRVRISLDCRTPLVWAFGSPAVVLPSTLVRRSSDEFVKNVLAHELAHLKRRDHWICWLELAAGCLFWWLPTFWWSQRQLRQAADQAADAWAVWTLGSRKAYAESLLTSIELCCAQPLGQPALGWSWGGRETVARRLTMIMRDPVRHRLSRPAWLVALAVGLLALPVASQRSQAQPEDRPPPESRRDAARREVEARESRRDGERRVEVEIRREEGPRDGERREIERREGDRRDADRPEPRRGEGERRIEERRVIIGGEGGRSERWPADRAPIEGGRRGPPDPQPRRGGERDGARDPGPEPGVRVERFRVRQPGEDTDRRLRELEEKVDLLLREIRELREEARRPGPMPRGGGYGSPRSGGYGELPGPGPRRLRDDGPPDDGGPRRAPGPPDRPDRPARPDSPDQPERPDRPERQARPARPDQPDRPREPGDRQAGVPSLDIPAPSVPLEASADDQASR